MASQTAVRTLSAAENYHEIVSLVASEEISTLDEVLGLATLSDPPLRYGDALMALQVGRSTLTRRIPSV